MDMSMEAAWPPVVPSMTNLPITDPLCTNESCTAFYAAENASQEAVPFATLNRYGHWITWYYLSIIGFCTLLHIAQKLHDRKPLFVMGNHSRPSVFQRVVAIWRFIAYRRLDWTPLKQLGLPLNGMLMLLVSSVLFAVLITFAIRPYYRAHLGYGSPPLAIRSGFAAFACTPIMIALAGKANIITLLTGVSHEKLNVIHQWTAWITFGLAWAHTIPFLWISYTDGGSENVAMQFFMGDTGTTEWGGIIPLIILFCLCIFSLGPIRSRFYETFYQTHILLAITYFGLLFWHAGNILDSWVYLWATLALWLSSWLARTFWYTRPLNIHNQWFSGSPASLTQLPGNMTRLEILAPQDFKFKPSQHCFLRIPSISILGNHPFTIASSYIEPSPKETQQSLVFYARSHAGFTRQLEKFSTTNPENELSVWIEGPYGGSTRPIERLYDTLVLVAGGSGISACLSWVEDIAQKVKTGYLDKSKIKRVVLIWIVREERHLLWAQSALQNCAMTIANKLILEIQFHITDIKRTVPTAEKIVGAKEDPTVDVVGDGSAGGPGEYFYGRPIIHNVLNGLQFEGSIFIIGCGPESLRADLANTCARLQKDVVRGKLQEVAMHLEAFGW